MKKATTLIATMIVSSLVITATYGDDITTYIPFFEETTAPAIQLDVRGDTPNIGFLVGTEVGTGVHSGATEEGGVGVWAVGINGATALKVQGDAEIFNGKIVKEMEMGHTLTLYDPVTGNVVGVFEYSFQ